MLIGLIPDAINLFFINAGLSFITTFSAFFAKNILQLSVFTSTENVLFICGGAFENLTMKPEEANAIGFLETKEEKPSEITERDVIKQGILPELVGRLPIITRLHDLSEDDLKKILTEPENSITKQYNALMSLDDVILTWDESALNFIAKTAKNKGTGARGLKSIIEKSMNDLMFSIPGTEFSGEIIIKADNDKIICTDKNGAMVA